MVLFSESCKISLDGKCVAITGANTGIGKETAMDLSRRGAKVLMLCRNKEKSQVTIDEIRKATGNEIIFYTLDLSSLESVRKCAEDIKASEEKIDILINNAGIMMCPKATTVDGFDLQLGTNHLGHFLLTELLMPLVKKSVETGFKARIVILSSSAHNGGKINWDDIHYENTKYSEMTAYAQSKLANILHAKELANRLEGTGITTYAVHPGVVNTELSRHAVQKWYFAAFNFVGKLFFKSPLQGAQTTLYCALEPKLVDQSGKYYAGCGEKEPQSLALVEEDQKRLWRLSEEMVGLKA